MGHTTICICKSCVGNNGLNGNGEKGCEREIQTPKEGLMQGTRSSLRSQRKSILNFTSVSEVTRKKIRQKSMWFNSHVRIEH